MAPVEEDQLEMPTEEGAEANDTSAQRKSEGGAQATPSTAQAPSPRGGGAEGNLATRVSGLFAAQASAFATVGSQTNLFKLKTTKSLSRAGSGFTLKRETYFAKFCRLLCKCCHVIPWPDFPVIDPQNSIWLDRWDFVVLLILLEVTFHIPFELAYLEVRFDSTFAVNRFIDGIFLVDMALRFFISVPDPRKRGCWVSDHQNIAYIYLTGWFFPDVLSLVPVDIYILYASQNNPGGSGLKALRLARILRLAKVTQSLRLLQRWRTTMGLRNWLVSIVGLFYCLSVCCHWCACLWGGIGRRIDPDHNWINALQAGKGGPEDMYEDPYEVYTIALYWAVYTMAGIGYGDICPQNAWEYRTALLCMSVMAGFYAVVIAQVCAITSTFSVHEVNFKRTMDDLNWLLSDWKVDPMVRRRLRAYFMESRDLQRTQMQKNILEQMSPKLQGEVLNGLHRPWTKKVRFLQEMSDEALVAIVQRLEALLFAPDELILGDRTLFIVRRGVAVRLGKVMVSGTSWGEDMVLHNTYLRMRAAARALCFLELSALRYRELMQVAEEYPELLRKINTASRMIAVHRSIVLVSRVLRQLQHHGMLQELTSPMLRKLVEAALAGDVDGDVIANPTQRARVMQLFNEVRLDDDWDEEPDSDPSPGVISRASDEKGLRSGMVRDMNSFGPAKDKDKINSEFVNSFISRVELLLATGRKTPFVPLSPSPSPPTSPTNRGSFLPLEIDISGNLAPFRVPFM